MVEFEHSVTIRKPVADVFAYMADFGNNPKWGSGIVETAKVSGSIGQGTSWREVIAAGKRRMTFMMTVDRFEPNHMFHFQGVGSVLRYDVTATFTPSEGGTKVAVEVRGKPKGMGVLFRGTIERTFRESVTGSLNNLKRVLEGTT